MGPALFTFSARAVRAVGYAIAQATRAPNVNKAGPGLVVALAAAIAIAGIQPYAGGWQDGSRLAMVEALVDHHTWAIDDSIFVTPTEAHDPYPADKPILRKGTPDKLFI